MCNNNGNCISELLEKILIIQQINNNNQEGCTKPFLGGLGNNYNTRPINLYCCCTGALWTMPFTYNEQTGESSVFRIENVNENCATFRILIPTETGYTSTNNFFTIDLKYVSCIKCLEDTFVTIL